jgi:trigger factor
MLDRIRERNARFEPVADRASEAGDTLTLDVTRTQRTAPAGDADGRVGRSETSTDVSAEIGASINPPGFDAHVTGLVAGDRRTFTVTFPEDYGVEHLRGADVDYDVTVKALRRKILADLDDEFAKDLGLDTLAALRERVHDDLLKDAERTATREMRDDLLRQLASRVTVEVPETLVSREVDRRIEEFVRVLVEQHVDPMKAGVDWEDFRARQRGAALDTVKATLMLDEVARVESIEVPDADVDAELKRFADASGRTVGQVRARLEREGGLARLVAGMRRERVVEFLMARATIVTL